MPAPSQKRLTVITFEHFVLPFIRSYIAEGDIPPLSEASQMFNPFSWHTSCMRFIIASFNFIIAPFAILFFAEFHNYYMNIQKIFLVEFHDIDKKRGLVYNINIGVPRFFEKGGATVVISFIGHRSLYNSEDLFESVRQAVVENIDVAERVVFFCGGYGDFDDLCARVCRSIKKDIKNCEIIFVTPYMTEEQQKKIKGLMELNLYDSVIYPPLEQTPLKFAISRRNEWMVEQSDFIIAYVEYSFGGAYQSLTYARRRGKRILNLAE